MIFWLQKNVATFVATFCSIIFVATFCSGFIYALQTTFQKPNILTKSFLKPDYSLKEFKAIMLIDNNLLGLDDSY